MESHPHQAPRRPKNKNQPGPIELYDLDKDPSETTDVAAQHADIVARLAALLREQHVKSSIFPLRALDGPNNR